MEVPQELPLGKEEGVKKLPALSPLFGQKSPALICFHVKFHLI